MASRFEEFIDIDKFKKALQYAAQATGLAFSVLDPLGNTIIKPINEAEFCIAARHNKAVCDKCVDCIVHSAIAAAKSKRTHFFKCQYGILEFVVHIFINGEYVSAVCGGEVRTDIHDYADYVYPQEEFDDNLNELYEGLRTVERERYLAATKLIEMMVKNLSSLDVMLKIAKTSADTRKVDERVKKAVEYIQQNYSKKISMAQLADLSCVSENYFSKLFVRVMKTSVSDYIASYRIEKSKEYLLQTDLKVSKISEMVGFEDPAYFHRVFKKYTGMTPHEFRDAARV